MSALETRSGDVFAEITRLKQAYETLKGEKDLLERQLRYTVSAYQELDRQIATWSQLWTSSQSLVRYALTQREAEAGIDPNEATQDGKSSTSWAGGTWLMGSAEEPLLHDAEEALSYGKCQHALTLLAAINKRHDITPDTAINAKLLTAAVLRNEGQVDRASANCDEAVEMAVQYGYGALLGKARFHRGLCYYHAEDWAAASWEFTLASHTPAHAREVEVHKNLAESKRQDLEFTDPRKYLDREIA